MKRDCFIPMKRQLFHTYETSVLSDQRNEMLETHELLQTSACLLAAIRPSTHATDHFQTLLCATFETFDPCYGPRSDITFSLLLGPLINATDHFQKSIFTICMTFDPRYRPFPEVMFHSVYDLEPLLRTTFKRHCSLLYDLRPMLQITLRCHFSVLL